MITILIGIILLNLIPAVNGLTDIGVRVIAVFFPCYTYGDCTS